jgi:hypothetical protein
LDVSNLRDDRTVGRVDMRFQQSCWGHRH